MDLKGLFNTPPWEWPRGAEQLILKTLVNRHATESDRRIAAELGGDLVVMNDELADALLAIVASSEESADLRATAATSLGPVLEEADISEFEEPDDVPIAERTFNYIRDLLRTLYLDQSQPKEVRRRILEAAVRSPQNWQVLAINAAYNSGDREWMLTAVFSMRWVRGFEEQILEALENPDPQIHFEAVNAAGGWELDAAWPHVVALVNSPATSKDLLIAAIEAVGSIHPQEAEEVLEDLLDSSDEEIAGAAEEAIAMALAMTGEMEDEDEDEEGEDGEGKGGEEWVN